MLLVYIPCSTRANTRQTSSTVFLNSCYTQHIIIVYITLKRYCDLNKLPLGSNAKHVQHSVIQHTTIFLLITHGLHRLLQAGVIIYCIWQEPNAVEYRSISWGRGKWRATAKEKARDEDDLQEEEEEEEERRSVGVMGGQRRNRPQSHFAEITESYQCRGMMGGESLSLPEC